MRRVVAGIERLDGDVCKQALTARCPMEFHRNLVCGFLFWRPNTPLVIEAIKHGARSGLPDSSDTTFSRLQIHFGFDAEGHASTGIEDASNVKHKVGSFTAAATQSTNAAIGRQLFGETPTLLGLVFHLSKSQQYVFSTLSPS